MPEEYPSEENTLGNLRPVCRKGTMAPVSLVKLAYRIKPQPQDQFLAPCRVELKEE
jgi:hypothetical protein